VSNGIRVVPCERTDGQIDRHNTYIRTTYVHTYIHTYTHTYVHTYIHTYIRTTYVHTYIYGEASTVELHLSGLIGTASHPDMQKIRMIGFFFENRLHW